MGILSTQFPQASGLGETWDPELLRQVGAIEGHEARVYYKEWNGTRASLAIRAPVVDLARDPRAEHRGRPLPSYAAWSSHCGITTLASASWNHCSSNVVPLHDVRQDETPRRLTHELQRRDQPSTPRRQNCEMNSQVLP